MTIDDTHFTGVGSAGAAECLRSQKHARFRGEMIEALSSGLSLPEMFDFFANRAMEWFGCDAIGHHIDGERVARFFAKEEAGKPGCLKCESCRLIDFGNPCFSRPGVYRFDELKNECSLGIDERCPMHSALVASIHFDGRLWASLALMKTGVKAFAAMDEEDLSLFTKIVAMNLRRKRTEKARNLFFSTVSHDIRTPLNAIIGYSELLRLGIDDAAERRSALDAVAMSGKALLELINDVLDLSKLEADAMAILPRATKCGELIDGVAHTFSHEAARKGVFVKVETKGDLPVLMVDPKRLRQILFNLVGNAVKFTDKGGVTVRVSYAEGVLALEVADTGRGMRAEDLSRIMQPFVQVANGAGAGEGTGLGLAICKGLVSKMGGDFSVSSELGKGSVFRVVLRGVSAAERGAMFHAEDIAGPPETASQPEFPILVVDDSPVNRSVLKALLARTGQTDVDTAENGQAALERLRSRRYALMLTDLWMPVMDGYELARRVRADESFDKMKMYAVTADIEARKPDVESSFDGILLKPVTLSRLSGIVGRRPEF